ncbi:hypothetical protein [Maribacter sp. 1_2014MBL_MicDiv]|uniref:hypothetical protein n=1 Tax=Maribacter sp. 1_2014MBL_MicDiv TaxID=1644130 RepID=UPI0008F5F8E0|nr:hypothetical protein [Maribacter sp. 1_2014MBL_MicDiv]APA66333.1 hypothetical protein YQ22_09070 [Maribacter sp. 1_2014MBL_MicDiv]
MKLGILNKKMVFYFVIFLLFTTYNFGQAELNNSILFNAKNLFPLKLQYNNKQVKKQTDKNNAVYTDLIYKTDISWDTIPVYLNARGNFRRANCYFPPLKMNIKKSFSNNTPFEGHKKLKIVLPCLLQSRANDDVLKEYLAYKIYELVSDTHFKTRLATIEYEDTRGEKSEIHPLAAFIPIEFQHSTLFEEKEAFASRKPKTYHLKAVLIEDDKIVAKRHGAQVLKRFVHPLNQAEIASITNAFFQFMIGNTDFSTAYQHNQKLIFKEGKTIPLPYDFDMSGLVNANYAVVSNIQNTELDISNVQQRMYRGFKRDETLFEEVRQLFINKRPVIYYLIESLKIYFEDKKSHKKAEDYIKSFYAILDNDSEFKSQIVNAARLK